jgi:hypothetical protein
MDSIVFHSMQYGEVHEQNGRVQVDVDTPQDGMSAWRKNFHDAKDIQNLLLELAPAETAKITDFIIQTRNFGEGHVVIPCAEKDFSKYGFEKLPPV